MTAVDELLTELGLLWLETTGVEPRAVKGHETPFVEMAKLALQEAGVKASKTAIERHFRSRRLHRERQSRVPWPF